MKIYRGAFAVAIVSLIFFLSPDLILSAQEDPASLFQKAYLVIREADQLRQGGQTQSSLEKYRTALQSLDALSLGNPDWNRDGVKNRADYCASFLWERLPDICGRENGLDGKKLAVSFIDVGQGDSTLIQCPGGENILIDGGVEDAGAQVVKYLNAHGVHRLDLVIATHPDADHIGGLGAIINAISAKKLVDPGKPHTTKIYEDLLSLVKSRGIPYVLGRAGDTYQFGEVTLKILSPPEALYEDTNDCSVVTQLSFGEIKFLFPGDAAEPAEQALLSSKALGRCQILKAGHHGSHHATSRELLLTMKPDVAIISCGKGNSFGHPHKDMLARLEQAGCECLRTDDSGDIRVESDGKRYQVWTARQIKPTNATAPTKPVPEWDKININTAGPAELDKLPMIGNTRARAIIQYRSEHGSFKTIDDIVNVPGIGPKTLEKIRDRIKTGYAKAIPPVPNPPKAAPPGGQ